MVEVTNCFWKKYKEDILLIILGYKIGVQKIRLQKLQIRRDQLLTLSDFQWLLGDISYIKSTIGIEKKWTNLSKTLNGDKDLNRPRELSLKLREN